MSERKQKPAKVQEEGVFSLPDERAIEAARARREVHKVAISETPYGTVVGLDYDQWAAALLDLGLPLSKQDYYRARWAAKGWIKLDGRPTVIGFDRGCEVWVKPVDDFAQAREERRRKIERLVSLRRMHVSALGGNVHVQRDLAPLVGVA